MRGDRADLVELAHKNAALALETGECDRAAPTRHALLRCAASLHVAFVRTYRLATQGRRVAQLTFQVRAVGDSHNLELLEPLQRPHLANEKHHAEALA